MDFNEVSFGLEGIKVGHAQDNEAATGCTVILCENGAVGGVDVRGSSPGTRDTDALNPVNNREHVHGILLSGGSAFGLDAATGMMRYLEERNIGRDMGVTVIPNVCAAILFDLNCGDSTIRPDAKMGYAACQDAREGSFKSGNIGAGTGACVGKSNGIRTAMKGGLGSCMLAYNDLYVGAIMAVNCIGDVYDENKGALIAGPLEDGQIVSSEAIFLKDMVPAAMQNTNTVIGCVVTNGKLQKMQATKLASISHNGIARAVRPAHTTFDGDTLFTLCTGFIEAPLDSIAILAVEAVRRAIIDGVVHAKTCHQVPSYRDVMGARDNA